MTWVQVKLTQPWQRRITSRERRTRRGDCDEGVNKLEAWVKNGENWLLGRPDYWKPTVFLSVMTSWLQQTKKKSRPKNHLLLLQPFDVHQHPVQPEYTLLKCTRMIGNLASFRGRISSRFALDHNVKIDQFVCEGGHVVFKAEWIFPNGVGSEDIVALALTLAVENDLLVWIFNFKVNVEGASRLDLFVSN